MDIGGGSIELALSADGLLDRLISLPFGAIRLTEQFLGLALRDGRPPCDAGVASCAAMCARRCATHLPVRDWRGAQVIGSGGTFTNLAGCISPGRASRPRAPSTAARVPRVEVEHMLDALQDMTLAERGAVPGLNPRAPTSSSPDSRSSPR